MPITEESGLSAWQIMDHRSWRRPNFLLCGERPLIPLLQPALRHGMPHKKRKCTSSERGRGQHQCALRCHYSIALECKLERCPCVESASALLSSFIAWFIDSVHWRVKDPLVGSVLILCRRHLTDRVKPKYLKILSLSISRLAPSFFRKCPALTGAIDSLSGFSQGRKCR